MHDSYKNSDETTCTKFKFRTCTCNSYLSQPPSKSFQFVFEAQGCSFVLKLDHVCSLPAYKRSYFSILQAKKTGVSPINGKMMSLTAMGVTLAQLVKASVGQTDVQRFEPHLGHNWLSCGVFLVKSRHFGLPMEQTIRPNWQSFSAGGSVAIQTWSIYKVCT